MDHFSLEHLLNSAGNRMRAEVKERLVNHPGEIGAARENVFREFLAKYLPKRFDVESGFAFDCHGGVSRQLDIVIANALVSPTFLGAGGLRFFPCESIVAVGQVKSTLTSKEELRKALDNIESAKALDRSAAGNAFDVMHKENLDPKGNHLHQIFTFLVILGESLSGDSLRDELLEYLAHRDPFLWPNVIVAVDRYLVTYCCDRGVCPNPLDAKGIALQPNASPDVLMRFYLLLGQAIEVTRVSGLPYWDYLIGLTNWTADVIYSATDDPPPYLSTALRRM